MKTFGDIGKFPKQMKDDQTFPRSDSWLNSSQELHKL